MAFAPPKKPLRATTALQQSRTAESSEIHEKMRCVPEQISSVPMTCGYAREFRVPEQWQRNLFGSFDQRTFGGTGTHKSLGTTTRDRSHLLQTGPATFGTRSASAGAAPRAGQPNNAQNRDPRGAFRPETSNPHYGRHSPSSDGNNGGNNPAYGDDGQMMSDDSPVSAAMPPPTPPGGRGKHPRSMEHSAQCSGTNTPRAAYPHGVTASTSAPTFQVQQQGSGPIRAASSGGRGRGLGRSKGAAASGLPIVQSGTAAATAAPVPGLLGRHGAAASNGPPITAAARQAQSLALAQQANVVGAGLAAPWSPSTGARGDAGRAAKKELAVAAKEQKGAWPLPAKASGNFALATTSSAQKLSRELNGRPQDDAIFDPAPPRPEIPMCATTGSRESGLLSSLSHPERKTYKGGVKMTNEEAQYVYDLATYEHNQRLKKVATRPALQIPHCTRVRGGADRVAMEM